MKVNDHISPLGGEPEALATALPPRPGASEDRDPTILAVAPGL